MTKKTRQFTNVIVDNSACPDISSKQALLARLDVGTNQLVRFLDTRKNLLF